MEERASGSGASHAHCVHLAYPTAAASWELMSEDDETIARRLLAEVERVYPGIAGDVEGYHVSRWPWAAAQLRPGDVARRQELRKAVNGDGRLVFAGGYLTGVSSIGASTRSGIRAGELVAARLGSAG
ncbi:MAG: FAD-dependent oxidoreductase [Thermoleophilia bacterium]|nr:FAD-dependent oxidoreductase [Thermoleophilia bacterium]